MQEVMYVDWEEVSMASDKGRREVHYFLKRIDGGSDLAVVGKEKRLRHMSYYFAIRNRSFRASLKLKSRREVIDWLSSVVSDSYHSNGTYREDCNDAKELDVTTDAQVRKICHHSKELTWVGSPWTCRKRRKHYQSFHRNGVRISVHDFIYVLAEEDKRLVAYLEDMYEDSRGNKTVVVRWFHKIDEVGSILPHNFNDREVYFSLCLQDLNIECIDGLATVLSPDHFKKFINEGVQLHTPLDPFVCRRQFENDEAKPFDITTVKGYWKQEILRYMNISPPSKSSLSPQTSDGLKSERRRLKKRLRGSSDGGNLQSTNIKEPVDALYREVQNSDNKPLDCKIGTEVFVPGNEAIKHYSLLAVGSEVEVLSQDSGMRGCWFRALIVKKRKDRVKVQYQDIQDADNEADKLEEWVLASRVAVPDQSGIRISVRSIVRPPPQTDKGRVSFAVDVGSVVDAWWHDGWWEGIVVQKEPEDKLHIFFPGEKKVSIFGLGDLRLSQEWVGNTWIYIKDRPDIASLISSGLGTDQMPVKSKDTELTQTLLLPVVGDGVQTMEVAASCQKLVDSEADFARKSVLDLSKDDYLSQLRWSSRKRRRVSTSPVKKLQKLDDSRKPEANTTEVLGSQAFEEFFISTSLKADHDNCKYLGDSGFTSSVVPPITSMVMSR